MKILNVTLISLVLPLAACDSSKKTLTSPNKSAAPKASAADAKVSSEESEPDYSESTESDAPDTSDSEIPEKAATKSSERRDGESDNLVIEPYLGLCDNLDVGHEFLCPTTLNDKKSHNLHAYFDWGSLAYEWGYTYSLKVAKVAAKPEAIDPSDVTVVKEIVSKTPVKAGVKFSYDLNYWTAMFVFDKKAPSLKFQDGPEIACDDSELCAELKVLISDKVCPFTVTFSFADGPKSPVKLVSVMRR